MREDSKQLARAILHDRGARRKLMLQFLMLLVASIAIGTWLIDSLLGKSVWCFALYWGGVLLGVCMLMLLCVYDMFMVFSGK